MAITWRGLEREVTRFPGLLLPADVGIAIERRFRGYRESRNLRRSHVVVVSFGSSGRTWLRVLMSRAFALEHDLRSDTIIDLDNLHRQCAEIPIVFFTHDNYLRDHTGDGPLKTVFAQKPVLLLVRHPADVAVSQYFQWKYRMRKRKKAINRYPLESDLPLFDFVMRTECGLPKIIKFMNEWAAELKALPKLTVLRYEDLRNDTEAELARIFSLIGARVNPKNIGESISWASVENMRTLENGGAPLIDSGRSNKDRSTADSYKARRARVGGYRDDFTLEQVAAIDSLISATLSPVFGYHNSETDESIRVSPERS
jgi:hypothetical protein